MSDADSRPRKKARKQRPCYSCEECRRLKMKCDRQVPCSNCVRRGRTQFCNDAAAQEPRPNGALGEYSGPQQSQSQRTSTQDEQQHSPADRGLMDGPLNSIPTGTSQSSQATQFRDGGDDQSGSYGTLMLSKGGRSKYLGPTAGSEWLKDSETQDHLESPSGTRPPSPDVIEQTASNQPHHSGVRMSPIAFPFNTLPAHVSTRNLLSRLPPRDEGEVLVESYYRYCAWHHDVAPKSMFEKTFDRVYAVAEGGTSSPRINAQEIALVFIILAQGTMFNIEMANHDSSAEEWLHLSEQALVKGDFLSNNMVAGVQTLHLMAHLHLQLDKGRRNDNAWPLWGLVMRLVQAMGLHRDGARWNLPKNVVEERRKVFWECNAADTFQAHCFSRPCALNPDHCDTLFPTEPPNAKGEKSYFVLRFELSRISSEILNMAMKVQKPQYSDVTDLDYKLCEFERNLPFSLRCRAALLFMPSRYPQLETAIEASPEPSRRSMTISFQQTNLALNISETIINLHRPYFAKALYEDVDDGVKSMYMPSFLTTIERCAITIAIVSDIHARFPAVSNRQWNFWYHVFNCALCLGTLALRDPANAMATFAVAQIDAAINLFTSVTQQGTGTPRYHRNLQWLKKLRARTSSKIAAVSAAQGRTSQRNGDLEGRRDSEGNDDGEDIELLGWRTRLIERAGQDRQTIRTIPVPAASAKAVQGVNTNLPQSTSPSGGVDAVMPNSFFNFTTPDSTNDLLHDFWDPLLLQDIFRAPADQPNLSANNAFAWWDDSTAGASVH